MEKSLNKIKPEVLAEILNKVKIITHVVTKDCDESNKEHQPLAKLKEASVDLEIQLQKYMANMPNVPKLPQDDSLKKRKK